MYDANEMLNNSKQQADMERIGYGLCIICARETRTAGVIMQCLSRDV